DASVARPVAAGRATRRTPRGLPSVGAGPGSVGCEGVAEQQAGAVQAALDRRPAQPQGRADLRVCPPLHLGQDEHVPGPPLPPRPPPPPPPRPPASPPPPACPSGRPGRRPGPDRPPADSAASPPSPRSAAARSLRAARRRRSPRAALTVTRCSQVVRALAP